MHRKVSRLSSHCIDHVGMSDLAKAKNIRKGPRQHQPINAICCSDCYAGTNFFMVSYKWDIMETTELKAIDLQEQVTPAHAKATKWLV